MKLYLDSIGCRLNQSEIEAYARQFRAAGHELVSQPGEADLVVINTCAVTAEAASDSRQKIRQAHRAGAGQVAVTGCWSTLEPAAAASLPGVSHVIPNTEKDHLAEQLLDLPADIFDQEPVVRQPVPGARLRTRAFIKAQDGCDNRCTFCVTTLARGAGRSRPAGDVLADIEAALEGGAREIVLTGVHLGSWGADFSAPAHLRDLVETILTHSPVQRLRLSSLEPWDLEASFFSLWQDHRLCRQLHLPLQSGARATLRRMARRTTPELFTSLVEAARAQIPDVALTTDIIVGFPGETEADFAESLELVRGLRFASGHVFTYSARPGTAAARMPDQVPGPVRRERGARMRAVLAETEQAYTAGFIGQTLDVLWETARGVGPDGWQLTGLTGNYLRVSATATSDLWNQVTPVRLVEVRAGDLIGEVLELA